MIDTYRKVGYDNDMSRQNDHQTDESYNNIALDIGICFLVKSSQECRILKIFFIPVSGC